MIKNRRTTLILAVFAALFLLSQWFFVPKTYVNSRIIQALQAPNVLLAALQNRSTMIKQLSALALENQSLRAQLAQLMVSPTLIKEPARRYVNARVYSSYPFNNADKMLITAGEPEGIAVGDIVEASPGIFLGTVVKVTGSTSEVQTLFDPSTQIPVKIGESHIDSLLVGGHQPTLTLISKKKLPEAGASVLTAAKSSSYGLTVGTVGELTSSELFSTASVVTPYALSDLNQVFILIQ